MISRKNDTGIENMQKMNEILKNRAPARFL